MDIRRIFLYLALALVGVALWNAWMRDYPPANVKTASNTTQNFQQPTAGDGDAPAPYVPTTTQTAPSANADAPTNNITSDLTRPLIRVRTNVLDIGINPVGAQFVSANLPKYPVSLQEKNVPVEILTNNPQEIYVSQSGIIGKKPGLENVVFTSPQSHYELKEGEKELTVVLKGNAEGLEITKTFVFTRDLYSVRQTLAVKNISDKPWNGSFYNQIKRRNVPPKMGFRAQSYNEASISSPEQPYQKLTFKTLDNTNLSKDIQGGWLAMQQQYFLTAWIPAKDQMYHYYSQTINDPISGGKNNIYKLGYVSPQFTLAPGKEKISQSTFYVGPELSHQLKALANGLDLTIDYGFLWPISKLLFWIMEHIYQFVGNWGWTIVLVTLLIKIMFYPFSDKSYKSMVKMRDLQPRMQALKERFGDDKQGFSKAVMELYKTEKVNPLGGCLPMIIQIPVFIALYYVLIESVELRQAPFMLWIQDLSSKDPYYVLPVLMGLSMFLQQKLSPPPPDPTQAKMMMLLPVVFTVFLISFPSGLVLYWLTNNLISILQQWYVMKTYKPHLHTSQKKKKYKTAT